MVQVCPTCQGTQVGCPTCGLPPKRKLPKQSAFSKLYASLLYSAVAWEVQGVDISKWNGNMDFSITKTKCQYVIMRLGYGTQWKDSNSDTYYRNARAQDMPVGVYWYCVIGVDPLLTARSFASEIALHPPQLDIVIDAEQTSLNPSATLTWLKTVDGELTRLTGKKPMIYTSGGFWNSNVARSTYWAGRNLWVANWTTRDTPYMPFDWSSWLHWQWSADGNQKGALYGSTGGDPDIDLNRYNGNCTAFNTRYGTHIVPIGTVPQPPTPPGIPEKVIVNTGEANLRHAPNPDDPNLVCGTSKYGKILYPEAIEKDRYGYEWYKLGKKIYIKKNITRLP